MKQVIVIRRDLHMRQGKAVAQGAHAAMMFMLTGDQFTDAERQWLAAGMAKICVRVESESELRMLIEHARVAGVKAFPVTDAGLTEFGGVKTLTCCAFGPDEDGKIDHITGHLRLL